MDGDAAPRFSIILPAHNRADVLPFAIRSALWQTVADFELLIAGDGCTDDTAEVVRSFGDPRIRWFDLPKAPGVGYANRNVVLREARGTHVAYLAHDDLWFPDHLERLGALIEETGAEFAYSRLLAVDLDSRMTPHAFNLEVPSHAARLWRGDMAITISSVVHRRTCLDTYGYWNERLERAGDAEMWHRIVAGGGFRRLAFLSEPTALHFVANWRAGEWRTRRRRVARRVVDGLSGDALPHALRLQGREGETQQQTAWRRLAEDPERAVRDVRRAVVQHQDAVLWRARTAAGLVVLHIALKLATWLDRLKIAAVWMASAESRSVRRALLMRTRPREQAARRNDRSMR